MGLNLTKAAELEKARVSEPAPEPSKPTLSEIMEATSKLVSPAPLETKEVVSAGTIRYEQVVEKIRILEATIKSSHPTMPKLLLDIWTTLKMYPECVTLIPEDQMEIVVSGLEKLVDVDLAAITIKAATSGKKSKVPLSNQALGFS